MRKIFVVIALAACFLGLSAQSRVDEWYDLNERYSIIDSLEYSGGFEKAQTYCLEQHGKFCPHTVRNWYDCVSSWEHAYYPRVSVLVLFSSEGPGGMKPENLDFGNGKYSVTARFWDSVHSARVVFANSVLKDYVKAWCMNHAMMQFNGWFEASVLRVGDTIVVLEALPSSSAMFMMRHYKKTSPILKEKMAKYAESDEEKDGKELYKWARLTFDTFDYLTFGDDCYIKRSVTNPSVEERIPYLLE